MALTVSTQLRERMIVWHYELHKNPIEIAELAGCSVPTVYRVLHFHRDYDVVHNPFAQHTGRKCALTTADTDYISALLQANPALFLDEIQLHLIEYREVDVSISTLSRTLRRLAVSNKKIAKTAMERNELL
ncbi:hypothetical protein BDZ94DRAFT_1259980, partial [Collybia nuda]